MLVLTRKCNEVIRIGDNIEVSIVSIEGDQVKLGISAPDSVDIHRMEVFEAIQKQNSEATNTPIEFLPIIKKKK